MICVSHDHDQVPFSVHPLPSAESGAAHSFLQEAEHEEDGPFLRFPAPRRAFRSRRPILTLDETGRTEGAFSILASSHRHGNRPFEIRVTPVGPAPTPVVGRLVCFTRSHEKNKRGHHFPKRIGVGVKGRGPSRAESEASSVAGSDREGSVSGLPFDDDDDDDFESPATSPPTAAPVPAVEVLGVKRQRSSPTVSPPAALPPAARSSHSPPAPPPATAARSPPGPSSVRGAAPAPARAPAAAAAPLSPPNPFTSPTSPILAMPAPAVSYDPVQPMAAPPERPPAVEARAPFLQQGPEEELGRADSNQSVVARLRGLEENLQEFAGLKIEEKAVRKAAGEEGPWPRPVEARDGGLVGASIRLLGRTFSRLPAPSPGFPVASLSTEEVWALLAGEPYGAPLAFPGDAQLAEALWAAFLASTAPDAPKTRPAVCRLVQLLADPRTLWTPLYRTMSGRHRLRCALHALRGAGAYAAVPVVMQTVSLALLAVPPAVEEYREAAVELAGHIFDLAAASAGEVATCSPDLVYLPWPRVLELLNRARLVCARWREKEPLLHCRYLHARALASFQHGFHDEGLELAFECWSELIRCQHTPSRLEAGCLAALVEMCLRMGKTEMAVHLSGRLYYHQTDDAEDAFQAAAVHGFVGLCEGIRKQKKAAVHATTRAIEALERFHDPAFRSHAARLRLLRAIHYLQLNRLVAASGDLRAGIQLLSQDHEFWSSAWDLFFVTRFRWAPATGRGALPPADLARALRLFTFVVDRGSGTPLRAHALYQLGLLYCGMEDWRGAEAALEEALALLEERLPLHFPPHSPRFLAVAAALAAARAHAQPHAPAPPPLPALPAPAAAGGGGASAVLGTARSAGSALSPLTAEGEHALLATSLEHARSNTTEGFLERDYLLSPARSNMSGLSGLAQARSNASANAGRLAPAFSAGSGGGLPTALSTGSRLSGMEVEEGRGAPGLVQLQVALKQEPVPEEEPGELVDFDVDAFIVDAHPGDEGGYEHAVGPLAPSADPEPSSSSLRVTSATASASRDSDWGSPRR
eukprot:tig00021612_g22873.t1